MLKILQDMFKLDFRIISHEVGREYLLGGNDHKSFTQVNMITGADKSGYYTFVEVVFMKEKKEINWILVYYFALLDKIQYGGGG